MYIFSSSVFYTTCRILGILTFAIFFWILKDVNAIISPDLNYGVSDLYRYENIYYKIISLNQIFEEKDFLYYIITFIFSSIGISFEFFVFSLICIYYFVFIKVFNKLIKEKNFFFLFFLIVTLSFWLQPLLLVAFRQGVAFIVLFSLLFRKYEISLFQKLIIVLISSCIHFSIIIILPLILFEKILIKVKLVEILFIITLCLYFFGFFNFIPPIVVDIDNFFEIDLRALKINNTDQGYKVGFSFYKFLAILVPFILYKFSEILKKNLNNILLVRVYLFFLFFSIFGMVLSSFTYHDRIMLFAWGVSPILICYSTLIIFNFLFKISNLKKA